MRLQIFSALLVSIPVAAQNTKSWTIAHRILTPGKPETEWTSRGSVKLTVENDSAETVQLDVTNDALSEELALALSTDDVAWYQLKLSEPSSPDILTSVGACQVRRANFRDEFVLHLDSGSAKALSFSYMPLVSALAPISCTAYSSLPENSSFDSKISWETAVPGMSVGKPPPKIADPSKPQPKINPPKGLKWIPGAPRKKPTAAGEPSFDPQQAHTADQEAGMFGFLKRYWYIVVPILIMNLVSAGAPGDEAMPQEGSPGPAGATAAAAAAVGGAAARSTPVRRRGKRD